MPSNEDFKKLTLNQIMWIRLNMEKDYELEKKAYKDAMGKDENDINIDVNDYVDSYADHTDADDLMAIAKERMNKIKRKG